MKFINRVLAALLALGLIIGGLLLVMEVIAQRVGSAPVLVRWDSAYKWSNTTTWDSNTLRIAFILTAIIGLVLLIAELQRSALKRLPVAGPADNLDIAYTRRAVAGTAKNAAIGVDGVRGANAVVGKRSIKVTATSSATDASTAKSLADTVTAAVERQLDDLQLNSPPRVTVTMKARRS